MFPLPDFVLFPCASVPIHVFERRYRAMVRDALRADRLVTFAVLAPGWERDYHGSPAFHPFGCLARVEEATWRPDDCYDLQVAGVCRVRIGRVAREYPYRAALVTPVSQEPLSEDDPLVQLERRALAESWDRLVAAQPGRSDASGLDALPPSLEACVNALCVRLAMSVDEKLALLEMDSVLERGRRVREWIERGLQAPSRPEGIDRN